MTTAKKLDPILLIERLADELRPTCHKNEPGLTLDLDTPEYYKRLQTSNPVE